MFKYYISLHEFLDLTNLDISQRIDGCIEFLDDKTRRLFACWAAEEAMKRVLKPDPRSLKAIEVARLYANNKCSKDDLSAAESAAESAAMSAARSSAWNPAWSAAWSAAESEARIAAESAAESAVDSAAWSPARNANWGAAWSPAESAARSAEKEKQILKLKEMITEKQKN